MKKHRVLLRMFLQSESGATAIEYALIGSLLSIAIIGSVAALNDGMVEVYEEIRSYIVPALEGNPRVDEQ